MDAIAKENPLNGVWGVVLKQLPQGLPEWVSELALLTIFCIIAVILRAVLRYVLVKMRTHLLTPESPSWLTVILDDRVLHRFARVLPPLVMQLGILSSEYFTEPIWNIAQNILVAYAVFRILQVVLALLDAVLHQQINKETASERQKLSLKSYIQLAKLVLIFGAVIIMIAAILNRSPLLLLSGLGALSAVLMLVFKDTILSFTAGVQLAGTDMLRVGDWIEMEQAGANGYVTEMSLHFVSVQNWDKTITTIPTYALISQSFKNWQGMTQSGGRRIKRSLLIDVNSVKFINEKLFNKLKKANLLAPYLTEKKQDIDTYNQQNQLDLDLKINGRRLTNLGTLRAYLVSFLKNHANIHQQMTLIVRQLATEGKGIPLQIYAFTNTTNWQEYENIQSDIFDHVYAVIDEFELKLYQSPSSADVRHLSMINNQHEKK